MTGFGSLVRAGSGLAAASYGLDITGQNIANADTDGYTRQRANQVTTGEIAGVPTLYAGRNPLDHGVTAAGATRLNDAVLDARDRTENSRSTYLATTATTASSVETAFPISSTTGLSKQMDDFFNSWGALANTTTSATGTAAAGTASLRSNILSAATTVTTALHSAAQNLADTATSLTSSLNSTVTTAQNTATELGQVNVAIMSATANGQDSNALQDKRDSLLLTLAKSVGGTATLNTDGSATVTVGGQTLVSGGTVSAMAVDSTSHLTVGGTAVSLTTGTVGGLIDGITNTVPSYQAKLDGVAATLANTVNAAHEAGYDSTGTAGGPFFSGTTAATITVAITDGSKLAASATSTPGGNNDVSNAQTIANLTHSATGASAQYVALVGDIGSTASLATSQQTIQDSVTASVDASRQSASGVNYDEEVTNLLMYQRSYQASSRVLTTIDDMLDTLINRTGKVGL